MRTLLLLGLLVVAHSAAAAPTSWRADREGWSAQFPDGWIVRDNGGVVFAGHSSEAGLLVVRFEAGGTLDSATAAAARGISADGAELRLRAPPRRVPLKAHGAGVQPTAVAAEFDGFGADGTPLSASALAVAGPRGAVTVLGVTSPAQLGALMTRVLAVASSVAFFAPAAPQATAGGGAGAGALRGSLCAYSGGSSMSTTTRANFDGAGHVGLGSESALGGSLVDSGGNETGRYVGGTGNQYDASSGTYRIVGDVVEVQWGGGEVTRCTVNMRQASGQITELQCDGRLFAAGLCE